MKISSFLVFPFALSLLITSCKEGSHAEKYTLDTVANLRMVYILDSIAKQNFDKDNAFSPEAQLLYCNGLFPSAANNINHTMALMFYKANTLLKVGQEKQAADEFSELFKMKDLEKIQKIT